ncbi:MAG: cytosine deaminase family metal-dependent hydrolase [Elainella sp. Prado103]|jgi:cytosine deaminase|nr:cytosine deaminase family metal-dependent hydrolase [Elainella sp. Prado103]
MLSDDFKCDRYWLLNARIPVSLLLPGTLPDGWSPDIPKSDRPEEPLAVFDLEIHHGKITQMHLSRSSQLAGGQPVGGQFAGGQFAGGQFAGDWQPDSVPAIDLRQGLVWSCFADLHTHLDKGQIWQRTANLDGTFDCALGQCQTDREQYWQAAELYRRMEFGLKCSYVHGTQALRTHLDAYGEKIEISLAVFQALQQEWRDRLTLQAVSLVSIDYFLTPAGEALADQFAAVDGVLGGFVQMHPDLDRQLDRVFTLAQERGLALDFHTDESGNPADITLRQVAAAALRNHFTGQIVCGHCCSLAVQPLAEVVQTIDLVKQAQIGIVSLPMCNLYLQDRNQRASQHFVQATLGDRLAHLQQFATQTPRWRGITLVHELRHSGIPVAFASDNCRDPFHAYGDHDGWEVFTQAVRIAQLDAPINWCDSVTTVPLKLMGQPTNQIGVGQPADFILFQARNLNELLARSQQDRIVIRQGKPIEMKLPHYSELDDLLPP